METSGTHARALLGRARADDNGLPRVLPADAHARLRGAALPRPGAARPGPARAARRRPAVRHARGKERAARAALWQRAKANTWARLTSFYEGIKAELARRSRCRAAAPDLRPGARCFLRAELPLAPTDEEKRSVREALRFGPRLRGKFPETKHAVIRKMRDEDHARRFARASQLSPDYEEATTEVWRFIRATPRGAPNGTDVRAWADKSAIGVPNGSAPRGALQRDLVGGQASDSRRRARLPPLRPFATTARRGEPHAVEPEPCNTLRGRRPPRRHSPAGRRQRLFCGVGRY